MIRVSENNISMLNRHPLWWVNINHHRWLWEWTRSNTAAVRCDSLVLQCAWSIETHLAVVPTLPNSLLREPVSQDWPLVYLELLVRYPEAGDRQEMADLAALETPEGEIDRILNNSNILQREQAGFVHIFTNKFPWLFHDFCDNFHDLISHYFTIRIKICSNDHSILTKMNDY